VKEVTAEPNAFAIGLGNRRANPNPTAVQSAFCGTDLDIILKAKAVSNIVLTGITTDVCVHSTMRDASDRG
jgi:nicotinamidase-related amidase